MEYIQFGVAHWELSLAFVVTSLMLVWNFYGHKIQGYEPITPEQAIQIINRDNTVILDVREAKELVKTGKITNSKNLNIAAIIKANSAEIGVLNQAIIVLCRTGNRSAMACSSLKKKGFTQIYSIKGGIIAWQKSGFPLVTK